MFNIGFDRRSKWLLVTLEKLELYPPNDLCNNSNRFFIEKLDLV